MAAPDGTRHSTRPEDKRQSLDPCHRARPVTGLERRRSCGHSAQALSQLARGHCKRAAIGRLGANSSCRRAFSAHCFPNRLMDIGPRQRLAPADQYADVQKTAVFWTAPLSRAFPQTIYFRECQLSERRRGLARSPSTRPVCEPCRVNWRRDHR